jgi:hypothetical protein
VTVPPLAPGRPRLPVYVFPCRIQQGRGEWVETGRAVRLLARAGYPLYHLRSVTPSREGREDPRAVPLDPSRGGPEPFPRVEPLRAPVPSRQAVAVVTWFGVTARRSDLAGDPMPGPLADRFERLREAHPDGLLILSLEEFGTARTSREAVTEGLRQAGLCPRRIRQVLRSPEGKDRLRRYRQAFFRARAGEREDVLHLFPEFFPSLPALREFPFALPIGPFWPPRPGRAVARLPATRRTRRVVWYASASSSSRLLGPLLDALGGLSQPVELFVRHGSPWALPDPSSSAGRPVRVVELGPESRPRWEGRLRAADLRVVGGSQSLVEAVSDAVPFLYFNGALRTPAGGSVGFRREKLLSLLRGSSRRRGERLVARDLRAFADLRGVSGVVRRALGSGRWRAGCVRLTRQAGRAYPPGLRAGEAYLLSLVRSFERAEGSVEEFVRGAREAHRRALGMA